MISEVAVVEFSFAHSLSQSLLFLGLGSSRAKRATALTDRKTGIGCDQLIIMEVQLQCAVWMGLWTCIYALSSNSG